MSGKKYVLIILGFSLAGALYAIIYEQLGKHKLEILDKKYVYAGTRPLYNSVLFIRDFDYKKQYFQYVKDLFGEEEQIPINIPIENSLPRGEVIYILEVTYLIVI